MQKVENGMFVRVDYKGTLQNGDVFDSSHGRQPLEIQMGQGQLIEGFEKALLGMSLNEKKTFTLDPEEAYGHRDENLTRSFDMESVPAEMDPHVGQMVALRNREGEQVPGRIVDVDDQQVTVDMNHPLAGEPLTFEIEVVSISRDSMQASQDT